MDQTQAEGQAEVDWQAQVDMIEHVLTDDQSVIVNAHLTDGTQCWCDPAIIREEGSADVVVHRSARQIAEQRDKLGEALADLRERYGVGSAVRDPHLEGLVRYV